MCRRCGEPDRRGPAWRRRARKAWLLAVFGDGVSCPCAWCGTRLTAVTLQQDRLVAGGPYSKANVVPACGPCNIARAIQEVAFPAGCWHGPVGALSAGECR